jgi:phage terminase large subunit
MITADSARPETISYMRKQGFKMRSSRKGKGSVEDGIAFIRSFKGIVIHSRCQHTADEFKLYSYKEDKLTGDVLPILEDRNNHAIDSIRYALEQVMKRTGSVGALSATGVGV